MFGTIQHPLHQMTFLIGLGRMSLTLILAVGPLKNDSFTTSDILDGEGDEWFQRNRHVDSEHTHSQIERDPLIDLITNLPLPPGSTTSVLEVGCGQGLRLMSLSSSMGWSVAGIDPSKKAIDVVNAAGCKGIVGTAECLDVADQSVDLLIYGFCLYLCDRGDLFRIAAEAHRVLKPHSWIAILDFWSPQLTANSYHHRLGVKSYKDTSAMFNWHPSYVLTDHRLRHHTSSSYTDELEEWVAVSLLRRSDSFVD